MAMPISQGIEFQTERRASAKVLSRDAPWWIRGAARWAGGGVGGTRVR